MRMSRRMGLVASLGMHPDSVTTTGGAMQYWASVSTTEDKWHDTYGDNGDGAYRRIPYDCHPTYVGRDDTGVYYNAALAFKTGSFFGKGKHIAITFSVRKYEWEAGFAFAAQLSKHDWSYDEAWMSGSKSYYSSSMTSLPNDPNAIASKTGTIGQILTARSNYTVSIDAEILPDTEYVLYLIATSGTKRQLLTLDETASYPMTITVTE